MILLSVEGNQNRFIVLLIFILNDCLYRFLVKSLAQRSPEGRIRETCLDTKVCIFEVHESNTKNIVNKNGRAKKVID